MNILISNDDGVHAPGLRILAQALANVGRVYVIAPDRNRSGASNALTLSRPIYVQSLENGYYSVEGTPTDCVHLALTGFFQESMDLVISGINHGANLGDDVLYSGTVAAAMEGSNFGLPAFAISLVGSQMHHYNTAAVVAQKIATYHQQIGFNNHTLFNVNVPDLPLDEIRGFEVTRLGTRHCAEPAVKIQDPRGRTMYWIGPPGPEAESGPGTDFFAIMQQSVSMTPLRLDLTHNENVHHLQGVVQVFQSSFETPKADTLEVSS